MGDDRVHAKVRERLRAGVLPKDLPPADPASPTPAVPTAGGRGDPCAVCEEPIAIGEPLEAASTPRAGCSTPTGGAIRPGTTSARRYSRAGGPCGRSAETGPFGVAHTTVTAPFWRIG